MNKELEEIIEEYKKYFTLEENGKVKCVINGHCFPPKPDVIQGFIKGKFSKLRVRYDAENALEKFEPFFVVSKNFPHMLYCGLTGQLLEKNVASIKLHMKGKKFIRFQELFMQDKKAMIPEMDLGPSDGKNENEDEEEDTDEEAEFWMPEDSKHIAKKGKRASDSEGDEAEEEEEEIEEEEEEEEEEEDDNEDQEMKETVKNHESKKRKAAEADDFVFEEDGVNKAVRSKKTIAAKKSELKGQPEKKKKKVETKVVEKKEVAGKGKKIIEKKKSSDEAIVKGAGKEGGNVEKKKVQGSKKGLKK